MAGLPRTPPWAAAGSVGQDDVALGGREHRTRLRFGSGWVYWQSRSAQPFDCQKRLDGCRAVAIPEPDLGTGRGRLVDRASQAIHVIDELGAASTLTLQIGDNDTIANGGDRVAQCDGRRA